MIGRFIHRIGRRNILSLCLLLVAFSSPVYGLADLIRGVDRGVMSTLAILGVLLTWPLARSRLYGLWVAVLTSSGGIAGMLIHSGELNAPLMALTRALIALFEEVWHWPVQVPLDITPQSLALNEIVTHVNSLLVHVGDWLVGVFNGQAVYDPQAATFVWGMVMWFGATWASWAVFRLRQPLLGITPIAALLAGVLNYTGGEARILLPLVATSLCLLSVARFDARERHWQEKLIDYAEDLYLDLAIAVILLVAGISSLAMITPSLSPHQVVELFQRLSQPQRERSQKVAESLGLELQTGQESNIVGLRSPGLPRAHLIGSGPELSQRVVMAVEINEDTSNQSVSVEEPPDNYYWRSLTYDRYTGRGWSTSQTEEIDYRANDPAIEVEMPLPAGYRLIRQRVQFAQDVGGLLYVTGMLITVNEDYEVAWRTPLEVVADPFGATVQATSYQADSLLPIVNELGLREAHSDYPSWILERYLALPESIPDRVLELARELTASAYTPFDQVTAIESYLRRFPYTLDLDKPPPDRDVADYFLFDLKRGYCDYYATTMVVLARAIGIPARLVSGYASGVYDPVNTRYVVTEADAHSWVEVYFPGSGWVEFEPTAGVPAIKRSQGEIPQIELPEFKPTQRFNLITWVRLHQWNWLDGFIALITVPFLGFVFWVWGDTWRLRRMSPRVAIERLYRRIYRQGTRLTGPLQAGNTPYEFAALLQNRLDGLAQEKRGLPLLAAGIEEIRNLTDVYARSIYSPHPATSGERVQAIQIWRRLRRRLWLAKINQKFI